MLVAGLAGLVLYKQANRMAARSDGRGLTGNVETNRYLGLAMLLFAGCVLLLLLQHVGRALVLR